RQARRVHQDDVPLRDQRRQPRALRRVRRLVRRRQRFGGRQDEGRRIRVPLVHEPTGGVQRRRDVGKNGVQPLPDVAVLEPRPVDQGRDEQRGGGGLPGRDQAQP